MTMMGAIGFAAMGIDKGMVVSNFGERISESAGIITRCLEPKSLEP